MGYNGKLDSKRKPPGRKGRRVIEEQTLILAARFALHLLYQYQHSMGIFAGSADYCNLLALLQAGLGNQDQNPQVSLDEIIARVRKQLGEGPCTGTP
jgi:hypothetical protein